MPTLECPTCRSQVTYSRPEEVPHRPFCSRRCELIDLGRWLNEEFRVSEEIPPDERIDLEPPRDPRVPPE